MYYFKWYKSKLLNWTLTNYAPTKYAKTVKCAKTKSTIWFLGFLFYRSIKIQNSCRTNIYCEKRLPIPGFNNWNLISQIVFWDSAQKLENFLQLSTQIYACTWFTKLVYDLKIFFMFKNASITKVNKILIFFKFSNENTMLGANIWCYTFFGYRHLLYNMYLWLIII